jgi:hypothetical protein
MSSEIYTTGTAEAPQHSQTGSRTASFTQEKALRVSNTEYHGMDQVRAGSFQYLGINGGASVTGQAPLQVIPSSVAAWAITNLSTSLVLWVMELGVLLESGTAGATGNTVYWCHFTAPAGTTVAANFAVMAGNGGTSTSSNIAVASNVTITTPGTSATWFPLAQGKDAASVAVASLCMVNRDVNGKIAIQPGKSIGIHVSGAVGTSPLFVPVMSWYETTATMG